jgi:uncharacterized protein YjbI with pentapeptide repeats
MNDVFRILPVLFCAAQVCSAQIKMTPVREKISLFEKTVDSLDLRQKIYLNQTTFGSVTVKRWADFSFSEFHNDADFESAQFKGKVDLGNCSFLGLALFIKAGFQDELVCEGSNFGEDALFENALFFGVTDFISDSFYRRAFFSGAAFGNYTRFDKTVFKGVGNFQFSTFSQDVSFQHISVPGSLDFNNCAFLGNLDFSNVQNISTRIDLTVAKTTLRPENPIRTKRGINLTNSDISKFKIDYSRFYLIFDSTAGFEYRSNVYQALLNTFKNDGYSESYELLDKEYRTFVYVHKDEKWLRRLDKYWWDFGYSKYYIFYWIMGLVVMFTTINVFVYPFLNKDVYQINDIKDGYLLRQPKMILKRFYYSLIYTSILFFSLSVKLDNIKYDYWYWVLYVFVIYLSGLICVAYLANFIITK